MAELPIINGQPTLHVLEVGQVEVDALGELLGYHQGCIVDEIVYSPIIWEKHIDHLLTHDDGEHGRAVLVLVGLPTRLGVNDNIYVFRTDVEEGLANHDVGSIFFLSRHPHLGVGYGAHRLEGLVVVRCVHPQFLQMDIEGQVTIAQVVFLHPFIVKDAQLDRLRTELSVAHTLDGATQLAQNGNDHILLEGGRLITVHCQGKRLVEKVLLRQYDVLALRLLFLTDGGIPCRHFLIVSHT